MHQIFTVRDVVDGIVSWMSPAELVITACVNDVWFTASIPLLWKVIRLKMALCLLRADGVSSRRYYQSFETPSPEKWERFQTYSKYVQVLEANERDSLALEAALTSRPTTITYLFPNCHSLFWDTTTDQGFTDFNALISPSLERFGLSVHDLELSFFHRICQKLKSSSLTLKCLQLEITQPHERKEECQDLFHDLLTFFAPSLTAVQIPEIFRTEGTIKKLYEIPKLCQLIVEVPGFFIYQDIPLKKYAGYDGRGSFSALENISFYGTQASLCDGFLNQFKLLSLQELHWHLGEELSNVEAFITTMVENCPQIQTLEVGDSRMYFQSGKPRPVVSWPTIRPLLRCRKLQNLSLHCFQVSMEWKEMKELLSSRTTWTGIELYTEDPLRMSDLLLFAEHCPMLNKLGANVNGFLRNKINPNSPKITFPLLTSVNFAYSLFAFNMVGSIASFFFEYCEKPTRIEGWNLRFWDSVSTSLCKLYIDRAKSTGIPMSSDVESFIERFMDEIEYDEEVFLMPSRFQDFPAITLPEPGDGELDAMTIQQILNSFSGLY